MKPRIKDLRNKHIKRFTYPGGLTSPTKSKPIFVQDASNCWLFSVLNNTLYNTGTMVKPEVVKDLLKQYSINPDITGDNLNAASAVCELYGVKAFTLDVLKQTQLFADTIKKGYAFVYDRNASKDFLLDIIDNGKIDKQHGKSSIGHSTNGVVDMPTIREFGTWGANSKANNFVYDNITTFVACVRAGAIKSEVLFIYK